MRWYTISLLCAPALASAQLANAQVGTRGNLALPIATETTDPGQPGSWSSFWWGDSDGDGFADAFVIQPSGQGRLLRNRGDGTFEDITDCAGLAEVDAVHMALWSDFDGDGRQDLFLPSYEGSSQLLRQDRNGAFEEITKSAGLDPAAKPIDAEWLDYDADGKPDLLVTTLTDERLYHNLGSAVFERIDLGLEARQQKSMASPAIPTSVDAARAGRGLPPVMPTPPAAPGSGRTPISSGGGGTSGGPSGPGSSRFATCPVSIRDFSTAYGCINANTVPTLGMLYPLSTELFIDAATGNVGMGTIAPIYKLDVLGGDIRTDSRLISTVTTGPPLEVTSSARVPNLNADLLDGVHASSFSQLGNSIESAEITNGTISAADLAANSVGASEIASNAVGTVELASGAVTSAKVAGGAISNGHVSASAAIAGTKVNADFGGQSVRTGGQLVSTTTSQPPLSVASSVRVSNLNADFIDGVDSSAFSQLGNSIEGSEITDRTVGPIDLDWPLAGPGVPNLLWSQATGSGGIAVEANSTSGSGFGRGVLGTTDSVSGIGVEGWAKSSTGPNYGIHGRSDSNGGTGVLAEAPAAAGTTYGVQGLALSPGGTGVFGEAQATSGATHGVRGRTRTTANDGAGVYGEAAGTSGLTFGVHGKSLSNAGIGVRGEADNYGVHGTGAVGVRGDSAGTNLYGVLGMATGVAGTGVRGEATADGTSWPGEFSAGVRGMGSSFGSYSAGVYAESNSGAGYGVYARAGSSTGGAKGVYAETEATSGDAIYGRALHTTGAAWGVRGETASSNGYGVYCSGDFAATGAKNFIQPHPTDPSKEIRFVCLEGNESGTYFRGSGRLEDGRAVIEVPEEFRLVSSLEGLTVMVTAVGAPAGLWVQSKSLEEIVVRGNADANFDYFVNGVRRGYEEHQAIGENLSFVPTVSGVEFGTQYPDALRQVLVENGTLYPDFTPNEMTAAAQGWTLQARAESADGEAPVQGGPSAKPERTPRVAPDPVDPN